MKFEEYFSIQEGFSLAVSNIKDLDAGLKDFFDGGIIVRSMVVSTSFLQCSTVLMNADPFLFVDNGLVYLFYEELKYKGKGVIRMTSSKDKKNGVHQSLYLKNLSICRFRLSSNTMMNSICCQKRDETKWCNYIKEVLI